MLSEEYQELKSEIDDLKALVEERTSFSHEEITELKQDLGW